MYVKAFRPHAKEWTFIKKHLFKQESLSWYRENLRNVFQSSAVINKKHIASHFDKFMWTMCVSDENER